MKYLNIDKMREGKFNSILKKDKTYVYEFEFTDKHFEEFKNPFDTKIILDELRVWLQETPTGNFKIIHESGNIWGVSFQKRSDALLYKMVWS